MSEIPNALTPDEWGGEAKTFILGHLGHTLDLYIADEKGRALVLHEWSGDDAQTDYTNDITVESRMLPSLIALANNALPDDDPRKITREDVRMLRQVAARTARVDVEITAPDGSVQRYEGLTHLAAKLAAFLPP